MTEKAVRPSVFDMLEAHKAVLRSRHDDLLAERHTLLGLDTSDAIVRIDRQLAWLAAEEERVVALIAREQSLKCVPAECTPDDLRRRLDILVDSAVSFGGRRRAISVVAARIDNLTNGHVQQRYVRKFLRQPDNGLIRHKNKMRTLERAVCDLESGCC